MDAQTFLYWSLAVGFIALALLSCIALIYLIRILKDFAEASDSVKDAAEQMNDNVTKIAEKVSQTAEQITEYVVKPFTLVQYLTERIKPVIEMIQEKGEELRSAMEESKEEEKPKKKRRFGRRK